MVAGFLTGFGFILGMTTAVVIIWCVASWWNKTYGKEDG